MKIKSAGNLHFDSGRIRIAMQVDLAETIYSALQGSQSLRPRPSTLWASTSTANLPARVVAVMRANQWGTVPRCLGHTAQPIASAKGFGLSYLPSYYDGFVSATLIVGVQSKVAGSVLSGW